MRIIVWLLRAFIFFTLFAFALNNQQTATVSWFFGQQWQAPMVIIVLAAFAAGCAVGVLAMLPGLRRRWRARGNVAPPVVSPPPAHTVPAAPSEFGGDQHPSRLGI